MGVKGLASDVPSQTLPAFLKSLDQSLNYIEGGRWLNFTFILVSTPEGRTFICILLLQCRFLRIARGYHTSIGDARRARPIRSMQIQNHSAAQSGGSVPLEVRRYSVGLPMVVRGLSTLGSCRVAIRPTLAAT